MSMGHRPSLNANALQQSTKYEDFKIMLI
uniref:Uncharacterized protein n=1 Tax=Anguilla anguilla TaxID=7936 RepID=A0A0E9TXG9_ANGAN